MRIYRCPKCDATLSLDQSVVLVAGRDDRKILVGLHPEPGNYEVHLPPDVERTEGERWHFFCPVCREELATKQGADLCAVDLEEAGQRQTVLFSSIAGERATFVVDGNKIVQKHGEHAQRHIPELVNMKYILV